MIDKMCVGVFGACNIGITGHFTEMPKSVFEKYDQRKIPQEQIFFSGLSPSQEGDT